MSIRVISVIAVTILSLAGAGVALIGNPEEQLTLVFAFLAPTIVALLALARTEEVKQAQVKLNGEVIRLREHIVRSTDATKKAADITTEAANRVEHAVEELPPPPTP
jgi:hypothetical protein